MGMHATAVMFYGYCWDCEDKNLANLIDDWEGVLANKEGVRDPWLDCPSDEIESLAHYKARVAAYDKWRADNKERLEKWYEALADIRARYGCGIDGYGTDCYFVPYIFIADSEIRAQEAVAINTEKLVVNAGWNAQLLEFAKALDLELPQARPQWWLCSFYG